MDSSDKTQSSAVSQQHSEEYAVIDPGEVLDHVNAVALMAKAAETMVSCSSLYIDFSHTTRVDSAGIGALITIYKGLPEHVKSIHLINLPAEIEKTFTICQLGKFFNIQSCK